MGRIYNDLLWFFNDWFYLQNDDEPFLKVRCEGKDGEFDCYAQAIENPGPLVFYSLFPRGVQQERRPAMAELISRINYGLLQGCFELDLEDGEVRFRTSLFVDHTELTSDLIRPVVNLNLHMTDRDWPEQEAMMEGGKTPAEALRQIRQPGGSSGR